MVEGRITGDTKEIERQPSRETMKFNIDVFSIAAAAEQVKTGTRELKRSSTVAENGSFWEREPLINTFWLSVVTEGIQGSLINKVRVVDVVI
jgi:hypothetical protein